MGQRRFAIGMGIATAFAGAVGMMAPQALAAPEELAPGVSCDGFVCTNDTDDIYRIESELQCPALPGSVLGRSVVAVTYVRPHATAWVDDACPAVFQPGGLEQQPPVMMPDGSMEQQPPVATPGEWVRTEASGVQHNFAVVDNEVSSGSAG